MESKKIINDITDMGEVAISEVVGAGIGSVVAGPVGTIGGALLGTAVGKVMKRVMGDVAERTLSKRESQRIQTVIELAQEKIEKNIKDGKKIREDGFFEEKLDNSNAATEILEGSLLVAQREYEEKKIPYIANMYANIIFCNDISRPMANQLIKIVSEVTYRQLVILKLIGDIQVAPAPDFRMKKAYTHILGLENVSIASEIFDLYQRSILFSSEAIIDAAGINPSKLTVAGYGAHLYNMMELNKMP